MVVIQRADQISHLVVNDARYLEYGADFYEVLLAAIHVLKI